MRTPRPWKLDDLALAELFGPVGDEAILPAGNRLVDQTRPAPQCFVILEGQAVVEAGDGTGPALRRGCFVGGIDAAGLPAPLSGLTIRLVTAARVLVVDPTRLTALIEARPELASIWRSVAAQLRVTGTSSARR